MTIKSFLSRALFTSAFSFLALNTAPVLSAQSTGGNARAPKAQSAVSNSRAKDTNQPPAVEHNSARPQSKPAPAAGPKPSAPDAVKAQAGRPAKRGEDQKAYDARIKSEDKSADEAKIKKAKKSGGK